MIEHLERRRLLASIFAGGVLTVDGTDGSNAITVNYTADKSSSP